MPTVRTPPLPPALALKKQAMALDAEMIRRLRGVRRLSYRLVHEFRLTAKRQLAWWRLARPMAGKTTVRNANDRLADAARLLAPARDAYVMRRTVGRLACEAGPGDAEVAFAAATSELAAVPAGSPPKAFPALRERLIRALASDAASWRRLPVPPNADARVLAAVIDTYRRARRQGRRAMRRPLSANLHSWRKWVKMLIVHTELILGEHRSGLRTEIRRLVRLGCQLGRCHDLMVLDGWLAWRASSGALSPKDARRMRALLARRQERLYSRCVRLGGRLFAAKPKVFAIRLPKVPGREV
jgi:CHAD domain